MRRGGVCSLGGSRSVRAALVLSALVGIVLYWTNPPEADLGWVAIMANQAGHCDTLGVALLDRRGMQGQEDSIAIQMPCFSRQVCYTFWAVAVDTSGNVSEDSNYADACQDSISGQ